MRLCAKYRALFLIRALLAAAALAFLTGGCNSNAKPTSRDEASTNGAGARIDMNCLGNHVENPPEAFRYSFKSTAERVVDKQAEITPQSMEITIQNNAGSRKYHAVRSDQASWDGAVLNLSGNGLTAMSARVDSIKNKSSVSQAGTEQMNGYQTTKYSIDTTSANSSDMRAHEMFFGSGSYEKGTIWVTADGCPVKLVLEEGTKGANGSMGKVHYDIDVIKR